MGKLIQLLLFGHFHKWKTTASSVLEVHDPDTDHVTARGVRHYQQCETCGKVRKVDLA